MAKLLQSSNLCERLKDALIRKSKINPLAQVLQATEVTVARARRYDGFRRPSTNILDRKETESNRAPLWFKVELRSFNIGRENGNAEPAALCNCRGDLIFLVAEGIEHTRHVLNGVIRLQVRRLVGNEAVTGGVRLVEPVVCKRLKRLEHLLDHARGHATPCCARDELLLEPSEHVLLLLAHRIPQGVSLRPREATECRCGRHDVFLVHEHAVRSLQEWLKKRV